MVFVCVYVCMNVYVYVPSELGKLLYESNILHITSYFYEEVIILQLHITLSKK